MPGFRYTDTSPFLDSAYFKPSMPFTDIFLDVGDLTVSKPSFCRISASAFARTIPLLGDNTNDITYDSSEFSFISAVAFTFTYKVSPASNAPFLMIESVLADVTSPEHDTLRIMFLKSTSLEHVST